jgi:tRNA (guanine37-N1)-methyltransferase
MRFDVVTLFPETLTAVSASGITRRALEQGLWHLAAWNPRDFTQDAHRTVDDRPFGGGPGMVMKAEPLALAVEAARAAQQAAGCANSRVIVLSAAGRRWNDADARIAAADRDGIGGGCGLILVCGRYEGVDQRFIEACADEEVSIGDYVLSGGELAAMVLIDTIVRQVPGALKTASVEQESFADGRVDGPQYTRPEVWRGRAVPAVLLSGHHAEIERWRDARAAECTAARPLVGSAKSGSAGSGANHSAGVAGQADAATGGVVEPSSRRATGVADPSARPTRATMA